MKLSRISIGTMWLLPSAAFAQNVGGNTDPTQIFVKAWSIATGPAGGIACAAAMAIALWRYYSHHQQHGIGRAFIATTGLFSLGWIVQQIWGFNVPGGG